MLRYVLIGVCALLEIAGGARAWAEDSFIVLPGTQSPNGRFAVGWGLPKHPEIWNKARESKEDQAGALITDVGEFEEDVENYVVDLRAQQVVGKLGSHYWLVAEVMPNRHQLDVVWSAASDLVLVNHTFRWDCRAFEAERISDGKTGARLDLKKALDAKLRQHFKKDLPRGSGVSMRDVAISFSEPALVSGETFMTIVEAVYPTKGENGWSGQAEIQFALTPSKGSGIALKILALK
ncbi:MAG TPA: hypothetical protein VNP98_02045 [Chthoniobacterales bacterium]|nr:hypothetical protein [Chthoniobacterales bacterium]